MFSYFVKRKLDLSNAAFTHNCFDDQEQNLTFAKMHFQVLKLKYYSCNFKQAFFLLRKLYIAWPWQNENTFVQAFRSVSGCQTCMCKRSIRKLKFTHIFVKLLPSLRFEVSRKFWLWKWPGIENLQYVLEYMLLHVLPQLWLHWTAHLVEW